MSDAIDRAQDREQLDRDLALNAALKSRAEHRGSGRTLCDCGEPISPLRQQLGAERCLECQHAHEQVRR